MKEIKLFLSKKMKGFIKEFMTGETDSEIGEVAMIQCNGGYNIKVSIFNYDRNPVVAFNFGQDEIDDGCWSSVMYWQYEDVYYVGFKGKCYKIIL